MSVTYNDNLNSPRVATTTSGGTQTVTVSGTVQVNTEGQKATYSCCVVGVTPGATPTDVFTLTGSATKTIRVTRVEVAATATLSTGMDFVLVKRTAANTGGTSTTPSITTHDSNSAAASAVVNLYSANPSLGSGTNVRAVKLPLVALGTPSPSTVFTFTTLNDQAVVLRGTSQVFSLNLNGGSLSAGANFDISIEWTEE